MPEKKTGSKRIAVIGPVYPFKGGISHYTGLLVRSLKERASVRTVSYKMQYPKILFKKEQRDYSNDRFKIEDAVFLLNTANPFNIIRTALIINKEKPDLTIIQWWHPYFAPCYRILSSFLKSPVLFICHNVFPHERFIMDRFLTKLTLKKGDFFILHSEKEVSELQSILDAPKYRVNMHPTYSAFKTGELGEKKDTKKHLLFFGLVRPYKGLKLLLKALMELPDVYLTVAGDFGGTKGEYEELLRSPELMNRVNVIDSYIPDNDIQGYFENCDAVVLPYIDATQSGIAQMAFGFEKPVIATKVGGLPEVVTDGVTGILTEAGSEDALKEGIERFYKLKEEGTDFRQNIRSDAERFSWEHLCETVFELTGLKGNS
ncbi:MAG: glycosyltransferase [Lachnospiraceae bacterium]|nr:glycosyltransferase [Lachnospiraceae bacterium]